MRAKFALIACLLFAQPAAWADTIYTFDVNVTSGGGLYAITGTLTLDATTGVFTNSDLNTPTGVIVGPPGASGLNPDSVYAEFGIINSDLVTFNIPGDSLVGYTGGPLCNSGALCDGATSIYFHFINGGSIPVGSEFDPGSSLSLDSNPPTPEPPSLLLLLTGGSAAGALLYRRKSILRRDLPGVS